MQWLLVAEIVRATTTGGSYIDVPWRIVLHSTEGTSIEGAVAAYRKHGGWPHLTVDIAKRRIVQHYPFSVSARALRNTAGGVETNRARAIQIEIVGFAALMDAWSDEDLAWFREAVLEPIMSAFGIPQNFPSDWVGGTGYGVNAAQRMDGSSWLRFSGVCAHQHVTENSHWDAGRFPILRTFAAPVPQPSHPSGTAQKEDDQMRLIRLDTDPRVYLLGSDGERQWVRTEKHLTHWQTLIREAGGDPEVRLMDDPEFYATIPIKGEAPPVELDEAVVESLAALIVGSLDDAVAEAVADRLAERLAS